MDERTYAPEQLLGPLNEVEKKNAPKRLFVAGDTDLLRTSTRVSIVGSRKASPAGVRAARKLAEELAARSVVVVSGLAEGIDTAVHTSAIDSGGRTIAVLGTALSDFYPPKNRVLQERIMREHLVVSQFPPGTPSRPGNFPMRNRTMALLSDATIIVEAGEKSGSLHQGWEALRLGRPLFLMVELLSDPGFAWRAEMERYGAEALRLENLDLLFESLPEGARGEASQAAF